MLSKLAIQVHLLNWNFEGYISFDKLINYLQEEVCITFS